MPIRKGYFCSRPSLRRLCGNTTIRGCLLFVLALYLLIHCPKVPFTPFVHHVFAKVNKVIADSLERPGEFDGGKTTPWHFLPKYNQTPCHPPGYNRTSLADVLRSHSPGPREICRCNGTHKFDRGKAPGDYAQSTCSIEATLRGSNQSVVSFTLFLHEEMSLPQLLDGVKKNLNLMREIYPGWLMRVYTDVNFTQQVCSLVCSSDDLFFCDVKHLPGFEEFTVTRILSMSWIWRYLPLGDPSVGKFLARDLDSIINHREKAAVDEWLESGYPFHGMRDHPSHDIYIMAGMWGADNERVCWGTAKDLTRRMMMTTQSGRAHPDDINVLAMVIYTAHEKDFLTHDSYWCEKYTNTIPFPTQRVALMNFVGASFLDPEPQLEFECPLACRPSYGENWTLC